MKDTRISRLFGIEFPIVQGGMIWVSGAKLAAAVSEAGGLGLIGSGSMTPELLRAHIRKAKTLTNKPFGVNLPIFNRYSEAMVEVILQERAPIVFTSAGSPKKYTPRFKAAGMKVAHVVSNPVLALKCEAAGVDAVVCEGFEAGGHNGRDELTSFVLIPQVVDSVSVPVIAAGGIGDGRAMLAAFALGAEGVQIGTRFVCASEASCHPNFQQAVIQAGPAATHLVLRSLIPVRLIENEFCRRVMKQERDGADDQALLNELGQGRSRLGMFEGDLNEGELEIGQISATIKEVKPAAEIMQDLVSGYHTAKAAL